MLHALHLGPPEHDGNVPTSPLAADELENTSSASQGENAAPSVELVAHAAGRVSPSATDDMKAGAHVGRLHAEEDAL